MKLILKKKKSEVISGFTAREKNSMKSMYKDASDKEFNEGFEDTYYATDVIKYIITR